ncbi:MAG TPA: chorion class high-cysteine HCB protein 13 [Clostridiales bacterium]|jgi:hypothetical protein|nr:chorion class high-cysteine HCB protein 13 [Clostridiales bacterium]
MSDLTANSYYKDNCSKDNCFNLMFLILILLMAGGNNGFLGCSSDKNGCGCGCDNGFEGILPLLLILCLCGGSF